MYILEIGYKMNLKSIQRRFLHDVNAHCVMVEGDVYSHATQNCEREREIIKIFLLVFS